MDGTAIMEDSEEADLTEEETWDIVKDFIVGDHTPHLPLTCRPWAQRTAKRSSSSSCR